jgi:hypothetical protein
MGGRTDFRGNPQFQQYVDDAKKLIAQRLEHVCTHMPKQEFDSLVEQMAAVEIKYRMMNAGELLSDREDGMTKKKSV